MGLTLDESQLTLLVARLSFILPAKQNVLTSYLLTFGDRSTIGIVDLADQFRQTVDGRKISAGDPAVGTAIRMLVARAFARYECLQQAFIVKYMVTR